MSDGKRSDDDLLSRIYEAAGIPQKSTQRDLAKEYDELKKRKPITEVDPEKINEGVDEIKKKMGEIWKSLDEGDQGPGLE